MHRRGFLAAALLLAATLGLARPVPAETNLLRVMRPVDLAALPLLVMEHERLIERTAEAMGLGVITVNWSVPDKTAPVDALTATQTDFAATELVPFLVAADSGAGTPTAIRALGALTQRPYVLVTRNAAVQTVRDFGAADRIAVPALKVSGPALMLEMAAAQEWGIENYDRLSRLAVAQPDAAAAAGLIAGKGEYNSHFSRMPYADQELANPGVRRVMDSFDIAGPHSTSVLATTLRFRSANPEMCKAVLSALQQAGELIQKNPGMAAEIFATMDKDLDIPPEDLSDMIGDPDLGYTAAPVGVMRIADFMHRVGRLKRRPSSWQELFLPESRDLPGN
jgi:NitT/TauT family transport system substrate-binding protein